MNALSTFSFHETHDVRVQVIEGQPWFCLRDVCEVLSVDRTSRLLRDLDEKGVADCHILTNGGKQSQKFVNEPNLYRVIFRSNKPEAKQFQDWVFNEVLPTIRKTGSYSLPKPVEKRDYMTNSDMLNIKRLIYSLTNGMAYKTSCSQAIWHALRQVTGVPSPAKFEVQHIPVVAHELQRIYSALQAYVEVRREVEQELIKRIVRNQEDAQSVLPALFSLISATISEERSDVGKQWHRLFGHECQNLLNRAPNDYDHHQFNEQRLI